MRFDLRNLRFDNRRRVPNYAALSTGAVAASYLLDTYPAFAAYDVAFQLKADQVQMIEVREDGTGTFEWIAPSGGVLDETALLAHTGANNGFVRTVKDAQDIAATKDATQATAGNQPQIVSAGVVLKDNGKPAMVKQSTTTYLSTAALSAEAQPNTIFSVGYLNSGNRGTLYDDVVGSSANQRTDANLNKIRIYAGAQVTAAATGNTDAQTLFTTLFNTTSSLCRANGTQVLSGNVGTNVLDGVILMNSTQLIYACDKLQNVTVYSTDQTANFAAIETAINDLYGVYV